MPYFGSRKPHLPMRTIRPPVILDYAVDTVCMTYPLVSMRKLSVSSMPCHIKKNYYFISIRLIHWIPFVTTLKCSFTLLHFDVFFALDLLLPENYCNCKIWKWSIKRPCYSVYGSYGIRFILNMMINSVLLVLGLVLVLLQLPIIFNSCNSKWISVYLCAICLDIL